MLTRLVLVPALVAGLALSLTGAEAASTKTLDGKKVKTITWTATAGAEEHDADLVTGQLGGPERVECEAPRCAKFPFVFAPAKGVKAKGLMFTATWTVPVQDMDFYVAAVAKDGSYSQIATCGTFAGTSEKIYLDRSALKPGKKYAVVVDFYRTLSDTVTAKVEFPGTNTIKQSVPAAIDDVQPVNCGL
jgi:hypothetical protein